MLGNQNITVEIKDVYGHTKLNTDIRTKMGGYDDWRE